MKSRDRVFRSSFVLVVLSAACSGGPEDEAKAVTYWKDVKPILAARCEGCHVEGGAGPFDLSTYALAKQTAGSIVAAATARTMPPWLPAPSIAYRHDRRLTDEQIATLQAWAQQDTPEGAPADYVPPDTSDVPTITPSLEVTMKAPYRPDTSLGTDDYRCFVLDPNLTQRTAVTGFDIRPGDKRVVHHVIVYAVEENRHARLAQLEAEDSEEGYTCFGAARTDASMVGAWVPGTTATVFPYGTGIVLEANTKLVVQMHYNTLETQDAEDQTTVLLETAPAANVSAALIFPVLDTEFTVPAGEVGTVRTTYDTAEFGLPAGLKAKLHGTAPHMHLLGKSLSVEVEKKDGTKVMAVDIPKWDFHWQQMYFYEEPIEVEVGDKLTIECTFDNRPQNQPIVNGRRIEPNTLHWGEGTLEEMCLNFFYATY